MKNYYVSKVYISRDGNAKMIFGEPVLRSFEDGKQPVNGSKTLSLKNGFKARYLIVEA